jgi:predicted enzyme related to lactoylglutathione lyase
VWDELGTTDADGAQRFYEEVFGWTTADMGADFGGYRIFDRVGGTGQGHAGLMQNQSDSIPAMWTPYVGVEDTDATCAKAKELGANAIVEPMDVPTVGRFAVLADPQGAVFGVIKGEPAS